MANYSLQSRIWNFLKKPAVSLAFRLAVSGLLLVYLIKLSAFTQIALAFRRIDPVYLLAFCLLYFLSICLLSLRWKYLLKAWDVDQRFNVLFRSIMTGLFLNNFFPSTIGGDAFRLYSGAKATGKVEAVAATIFYERILSYVCLVTLGLVALTIRADVTRDWLLWLILGGALLGFLTLFALSSFPTVESWAEGLMDRYPRARRLHLTNWVTTFRFKVRHPGILIGVVVLSLLIQFTDVCIFRLVAAAIQLPVGIADLLLFVPLLYLAIFVPLSVNGIGVRESVFVMFSSTWGITTADAVAFSLTVFGLDLVGSLVGGIIYWVRRAPR